MTVTVTVTVTVMRCLTNLLRTSVKLEVPTDSIDDSELEHICSMRVNCSIERGMTTVDQTKYIEKKAAHFGFTGDGHVYTVPMEQNFTLDDQPAVVDNERVVLARSLNGLLIYQTRVYPCSKLATVVTNPTEGDVSAMRRVLQYLYDTRETRLTFMGGA